MTFFTSYVFYVSWTWNYDVTKLPCCPSPLSFLKDYFSIQVKLACCLQNRQQASFYFHSMSLRQWGVVKAAAARGEGGVAHLAITQLDRIR